MSDGAWIAVAALAGITVGGFVAWHLRGADNTVNRLTTTADDDAVEADRLRRLLRLLGATDRDFDDLDRGVLVPDVADQVLVRLRHRWAS